MGFDRARRGRCLDQLAPPQHRHSIGDRKNLADLVQNEQDRDPARLEAPQAAKERLHSARRQNRRRLVQDQ